ncbi:MAG: hypothetical protein ISP90_13245 [Nevskia sp.]|nr:hypothetical protein [Nevskia sp.]
MKRFTDGPVSGNRLGRKLTLGLVTAIVAGASACGGHSTTNCPNMAIATAVVGQADFKSSTPNSPNGTTSNTGFSGPYGSVAIGSTGKLTYILDAGNNRLLGYNSVPGGKGAAADFEVGQGGAVSNDFTGNVVSTTQTGMGGPSKVSIGTDTTSKQVYLVVADTSNNRVLVWNANLHAGALPGSTYYPPDLVLGQPDFVSHAANQGGNPSAFTLSHPTAAVVEQDTLFVADQNNNRVLIWNNVSGLANDAPANTELGQVATQTSGGVTTECTTNTTAPTDFCFAASQSGTDQFVVNGTSNTYVLGLNQPTDVSSDGLTYLMVSDTANNRVLIWKGIPNTNNDFPNNVIGQTAFVQNLSGSGSQHLNAPTGVNFQDGFIYVADTLNNRVLLFQVSPIQIASNGIEAAYVYGQSDFSHVAFNDDDQNGTAGDQSNNQTNTNPTFNTLHSPTGMFNDNAGNIYITDTGNNRILQFAAGPNATHASPVSGGQPQNCDGVNPQF